MPTKLAFLWKHYFWFFYPKKANCYKLIAKMALIFNIPLNVVQYLPQISGQTYMSKQYDPDEIQVNLASDQCLHTVYHSFTSFLTYTRVMQKVLSLIGFLGFISGIF